MKKTKTLIIILLSLFIVLLFTVLSISKSDKKGTNPIPIIKFTGQNSQVLTPTLSSNEFKISRTEPDLSESIVLRIDTGVIIFFNKSLNPESLIYEIEPKTPVISELDDNGTKLIIRGDPFWPKDGHFKLTIKGETASTDNVKLNNDQTFEFSTGIPEGI